MNQKELIFSFRNWLEIIKKMFAGEVNVEVLV